MLGSVCGVGSAAGCCGFFVVFGCLLCVVFAFVCGGFDFCCVCGLVVFAVVLGWLVWWFNGDLAEVLLWFDLVFAGSFDLLDCVVVVGFDLVGLF